MTITDTDDLIIVAFTVDKSNAICGQQVGSDGKGDYAYIFKIQTPEDEKRAYDFIEKIQKDKVKNLTVSDSRCYYR